MASRIGFPRLPLGDEARPKGMAPASGDFVQSQPAPLASPRRACFRERNNHFLTKSLNIRMPTVKMSAISGRSYVREYLSFADLTSEPHVHNKVIS